MQGGLFLDMKKKHLKLLGIGFFILGIFLLLNAKIGITGAVIGTSTISSAISLILGLVFVIVGMGVFAGGEEGGLEERVTSPLLLDTCYLKEIVKDKNEYKKLKDILSGKKQYPYVIYVEENILKEFKPEKGIDEGVKKRGHFLKQLLEKNALRLEREFPEYEKRKEKYEGISKKLLEQTPKYLTYQYLSEIDNTKNEILPEEFIKKHNINTGGPYTKKEILDYLDKGLNAYKTEKRLQGNTKKLLYNYDLSKGDINLLANALCLHNLAYHNNLSKEYPKHRTTYDPRIKNPTTILSNDAHLTEIQKIFNYNFRGDNTKRMDKRNKRENQLQTRNKL
jgi:hypothetical protein